MKQSWKILSLLLIVILILGIQPLEPVVKAEPGPGLYLNANGATETIPSPTSVDNTYTLPDQGDLVKEDNQPDVYMKFLGWNTEDDGSGINYLAGDEITLDASETLTLYANWAPEDAKTISLQFTPLDPDLPVQNYIVVLTTGPSGFYPGFQSNFTLNFTELTKGTISFENISPYMIAPFIKMPGVNVSDDNQTIEINRDDPFGQLKYHVMYDPLDGSGSPRWNLILTINQPGFAGILVEGDIYSPGPETMNLYADEQAIDVFFGSTYLLLKLGAETGESDQIISVSIDGIGQTISAGKNVSVLLPPISSPENEISATVQLVDDNPDDEFVDTATVKFLVRRTGVSVHSYEYGWSIVEGGPFESDEYSYIGGKWDAVASKNDNYKNFVTYVSYMAHSSLEIDAPRLLVTYFQDSGSSSRILGMRQFDARPEIFSETSYFSKDSTEYFVDSGASGMTDSIAFYEVSDLDGPDGSETGTQTQIMVYSTLAADQAKGVPGPADFPGANRVSVFLLDSGEFNLATDSFPGIQYGIGAGVDGLMVNHPASDRYDFWSAGKHPWED